MCGLFGIFQASDSKIDPVLLSRATNLLKHRGPDDEGYLLARISDGKCIACAGPDTDPRLNLPRMEEEAAQDRYDIAFGFRRLSIIDLTTTGHQPMSSEDGRYWIIYNGEIYNYLELRQELEKLGHIFHSSTDTEVLLAAYRQWGAPALNRLVGMFAFAILDLHNKKIFLARDFFGIKPLYYYLDDHHFAFCSEIKSLMELPYISRKAEPGALYRYLRYGVVDYMENTLFASIKRLEPAHYMEIDLDRLSISKIARFWQVDLEKQTDIPFQEASNLFKTMFMENIRIHMRSDVPLGATLSGGIDSSAVIACMRQLQGPAYPLHTFSFIAEDPAISEDKWVRIAASSAGVIGHHIGINAHELLKDIEGIVYMLDEPFGSTSMYAENRIYQMVKEKGIKVTLGGQGADEMLAGYRPYLSDRLDSLIGERDWTKALRFFLNASRLPGWGALPLGALAFDQLLPIAARNLGRRILGEQKVPKWMNEKWFFQHGGIPEDLFYHRLYKVDRKDVLRQQLNYTMFFSGLPALLRSGDRNSMMSSVESRVPFLTPDLVNFVFSLPEEYIINQEAKTKAVFNQAMHGIVPNEILNRRDKIGFVPPEKRWLHEVAPYMGEILDCEQAHTIPALNLPIIHQEWYAFVEGKVKYDKRFWRWINLILWVKCFSIEFD